MNDEVDVFGGFVFGLVLMLVFTLFLSDCGTNRNRQAQCVVLCQPAKVHDYGPAMCICDDGKTHAGKFPEYYRK